MDVCADGRFLPNESFLPCNSLSFVGTDTQVSVLLDQSLEPLLSAFELLALCCVVRKHQITNS